MEKKPTNQHLSPPPPPSRSKHPPILPFTPVNTFWPAFLLETGSRSCSSSVSTTSTARVVISFGRVRRGINLQIPHVESLTQFVLGLFSVNHRHLVAASQRQLCVASGCDRFELDSLVCVCVCVSFDCSGNGKTVTRRSRSLVKPGENEIEKRVASQLEKKNKNQSKGSLVVIRCGVGV